MTKFHILPLICLALILASCSGNGTQKNSKDSNDTIQASGKPATIRQNIIRRDLPIHQDFFQITNIASFDIDITEGPTHVSVEGDSATLHLIRYDVDGGGLTLSMPYEENTQINRYNLTSDIHVYVSCPQLRILANCGTGNIRSKGTIHTSDFHVGGIGQGSIVLDTILCEGRFKLESNSNTIMHVGSVRAGEAQLSTYGTAPATVDALETTGLTIIDMSNTCAVTAKATAPEIEVICTGGNAASLEVHTDQLQVSSQGTGLMTLTGHAVHKTVKCGAKATIDQTGLQAQAH